MGGAVSSGKNNDELIDHLVEAEFIKTVQVQRLFRAVDRGDYYATDQKETAYKDIAWKMGNLHISAPCVYSEVMEALKLKPGLSFLNLGSGSGYLSTMAGLILGPYGVNHGIELHNDVVDFAYDRLDDFLKTSHAIDEYDFCEPSFVVGNCLLLDSCNQQYDRVYCGASCPQEYEPYLKNLIKIGGILIVPLNDKLMKVTRTSETTWHSMKLLTVSFAPLISPVFPNGNESVQHIKLGDFVPPSLKHICRSNIRQTLRACIEHENPNIKVKSRRMEKRQKRQVRRIVIPIYDESDLSNHSQSNSELEYDSDSPEYTISSRIPSRMSILLEDFLRRHAELQALTEQEDEVNHTKLRELARLKKQELKNSNNKGSFNQFKSSGAQPKCPDPQPKCPDPQPKCPDRQPKSAGVQPKKNTSDIQMDSEENNFDSGLLCSASFITLSAKKSSSDQDSNEASSSSDEAPGTSVKRVGKRPKRVSKRKHPDSDPAASTSSGQGEASARPKVKRRAATVVWKRIVPRDSESENENEDNEETTADNVQEEDSYSHYMSRKIAVLPLPSILLHYLNYTRNF